ncbi:MAG: hypothetical protein IPJ79_01175 [Bacteroidetes bacterium]|nr:hypothetical protein [Bacteroidota bacterium]
MVLFQNSKDTKYGVSTWLVKFTAPQKKDDYIMFEFNVVIRADNGEILETDSSP